MVESTVVEHVHWAEAESRFAQMRLLYMKQDRQWQKKNRFTFFNSDSHTHTHIEQLTH